MGGAQLLARGKGGKQRVVPLSDSLANWFGPERAVTRPGCPLRVGCSRTGPAGMCGRRTSASWSATFLPDGVAKHALRHFFATRAYRGTRNIRAVQQLLGHLSVAVTAVYTACDDDEVRAAMMSAAL